MRITRTAASAAVALAMCAPRAAAQIDYRNLDDDRPARLEDAYPVERHAFELLFPHSVTRLAGGAAVHASIFELTWGVLRDAQIGLKAPVASLDKPGPSGGVLGLSGLRAFALYNFNTEAPWLPALALRGDLHVPAGALGGDRTRGEIKAIATRSFGLTRLHVNAAAGIGAEGAEPAVEGSPRWWAGGAVDRTLFRQSVLLVAEVYAVRESRGAPLEVTTSVGARWQFSPTVVFDAGLTRRLSDTGPDFGITAGLSYAFALTPLIPFRRGTAPAAGGHDDHR
jgi:hypothetical protein